MIQEIIHLDLQIPGGLVECSMTTTCRGGSSMSTKPKKPLNCHTQPYLEFHLSGKSGKSLACKIGIQSGILSVSQPTSHPHFWMAYEAKIWGDT